MEEYKPNSHKSKEEQKSNLPEKRFEKVITGVVKQKKKAGGIRLRDIFLTGDIQDIKSSIWNDVVVPLTKKALTEGLDVFLYGRTNRSRNGGTNAAKFSYDKIYSGSNSYRNTVSQSQQHSQNGLDYDNLEFETRGDADSVLDAMNEIISTFDVVSIGDLYDLAGVVNDNYAVSNKYGWYSIEGCKSVRTKDGTYVLRLPKATRIN